MKSERRHQLEKNELADRLAGGIESLQSYLPAILIGVVVLLVGAIGWGVYSSNAQKSASLAWTEFYFNLTAGNADSFVDLAEDFPNSSAAGWARQIAGDNYLQQGIDALYRNKAEGTELIRQAIEAYEEVDQTAKNPELRTKALLGLAQGHESLGEVEQAANYYQQVAKSASQPAVINQANQRLQFLTSESGKEFYSWFSQLDPKPDAPIELPSNLSLPPTMPDLQFGPSDVSPGTPPTEEAEVDSGSFPTLPSSDAPVPGDVPVPSDLPTTPLELPGVDGTPQPTTDAPSVETPTPASTENAPAATPTGDAP